MVWSDARVTCFKNEADLASLSHNRVEIVKEYFERVQVRVFGARTVAVGLFKPGQEWKWVDGKSFNGSIVSLNGITKGHLAWSNENNDWILKETEYEKRSDLYLCEKVYGKASFSTNLFYQFVFVCLFLSIIFCFT